MKERIEKLLKETTDELCTINILYAGNVVSGNKIKSAAYAYIADHLRGQQKKLQDILAIEELK